MPGCGSRAPRPRPRPARRASTRPRPAPTRSSVVPVRRARSPPATWREATGPAQAPGQAGAGGGTDAALRVVGRDECSSECLVGLKGDVQRRAGCCRPGGWSRGGAGCRASRSRGDGGRSAASSEVKALPTWATGRHGEKGPLGGCGCSGRGVRSGSGARISAIAEHGAGAEHLDRPAAHTARPRVVRSNRQHAHLLPVERFRRRVPATASAPTVADGGGCGAQGAGGAKTPLRAHRRVGEPAGIKALSQRREWDSNPRYA